jgi:hypothetical protein
LPDPEHAISSDCYRCGTAVRLTFTLGEHADIERWWSCCPGCGVLSVHGYPSSARPSGVHGIVEFDPLDDAQRVAVAHA